MLDDFLYLIVMIWGSIRCAMVERPVLFCFVIAVLLTLLVVIASFV
jgi:hypothetical protein